MKKTVLAALAVVALLAASPAKADAISSQDLFNGQLTAIFAQGANAGSVALSAAGKAASDVTAANVGNLFDATIDSKAISGGFAGSFQGVTNVQASFVGIQQANGQSLAASFGDAVSAATAVNAGNIGTVVINSVAKK